MGFYPLTTLENNLQTQILNQEGAVATAAAALATPSRQEGSKSEALAFRSPAMAERLADALSLHLAVLFPWRHPLDLDLPAARPDEHGRRRGADVRAPHP